MIMNHHFRYLRAAIIAPILPIALVASGLAHAAEDSASHARSAVPPGPKQIIQVLLRNVNLPLKVHPSCVEAGTDASDRTIGDYLSGFLAELSDPNGRNSIETSIEKGADRTDNGTWTARVMIGQSMGEVEWRWGVEFAMDKRTGTARPTSFRCIGAG